METLLENRPITKKRKTIPKELIYEMVRGTPIYYHGYEEVISGLKKIEQIMGSSGIQSYLVTMLVSFLSQKLNLKEKVILANEFGLQFSKKTWRNIDLAIFERKKVKDHLFEDKHMPVPPEVVIEVDTKADLTKYGDIKYYMKEKTDDLLNFGVKKVIWILTKTKKVMTAESNKDRIITNWDKDINIINDINVNINSLLFE